MTIYAIASMCPKTGNTIGDIDVCAGLPFKDTTEGNIETALMELIAQTEDKKMQGFYAGIYSAYVSMTLEELPWKSVWFMLQAATHWTPEDIYKTAEYGRA